MQAGALQLLRADRVALANGGETVTTDEIWWTADKLEVIEGWLDFVEAFQDPRPELTFRRVEQDCVRTEALPTTSRLSSHSPLTQPRGL